MHPLVLVVFSVTTVSGPPEWPRIMLYICPLVLMWQNGRASSANPYDVVLVYSLVSWDPDKHDSLES